MSFERSAVSERLPTLDILRFLAVASVAFFLYGFRGTIGDMSRVHFPELQGLARYGFLGVELLFVISGFVVVDSAFGRTASQFISERVGRVYPVFLVAVTLTALVIAFFGTAPHSISFLQWLTNVTFTAPLFDQPLVDGVYWALGLELVFYAWVAVFVSLGIFERKLNLIMVSWLTLCLYNTYYFQIAWMELFFVTKYGPYFISGVLLQRIFAGIRNFDTVVMFVVAVIVGLLHPLDMAFTFPDRYDQPINMWVLCGLHFGIYAALALALWGQKWIPSTRFSFLLGGLAYPVYLIHANVGFIFLNHLAPIFGRWGALAAVVGGVLMTSWVICRFAEPPGRKLAVQMVEGILGFLARQTRSLKLSIER